MRQSLAEWRQSMSVTAQTINSVLAILLAFMSVVSVSFLVYLWRTA
jgi:hypothetical protein